MNRTVRDLFYPDALERLLAAAIPVKEQVLEITEACGHVLAEDIQTPRPFPDTQRSAVDGYALGSLGATDYTLVDTLAAEDIPRSALSGDSAAAVMTGATVPSGAQAVVRVEDVRLQDFKVVSGIVPNTGENINRIGEEAEKGRTVLRAGQRLDPIAHSVLCCLGLGNVRVYRRPRVGILITGNELLRPGENHRPGMVYECNSFLLQNLLQKMGVDVVVRGPVADSPDALAQVLDQLAWQNDLVVTSGGVSMGKYDFIRPLLAQNGFDMLVDRTRIKPGRPMLVARREQQLFFGMPGYPAAFLVNSFLYLLPVLRKMSGLKTTQPLLREASLKKALKGRSGRLDAIRVRLQRNERSLTAEPLDSQLTSHFLNMAECDGLVMLDENTAELEEGSAIQVLEFCSVLSSL